MSSNNDNEGTAQPADAASHPHITREDVDNMLLSKDAFWDAPVSMLAALRKEYGIGDVGLAFSRPGTIEVDTKTLNQDACKTAVGAACEMATKGIFNPFKSGHDTTHGMGPQMRCPYRDHMFIDATAHTVTTLCWPKGKLVVTITFSKPEVAEAAGSGFR